MAISSCSMATPYVGNLGRLMTNSNWWLISKETLETVVAALQAATHEDNDFNCFNCQDWPPGSGCAGCQGNDQRRSALHDLESGAHITDAIPKNFQGD